MARSNKVDALLASALLSLSVITRVATSLSPAQINQNASSLYNQNECNPTFKYHFPIPL